MNCMAEVSGFGGTVVELYKSFLASLPPLVQTFVNLFLLVLVVVLYSIFVWKLYRFVSKKNIIELNLNQFNRVARPLATKMFAGIFYFIEYIIIMPFLVFFWFTIFTLFLIFLTEGLEIQILLIISAVIIGAIRMTSYYKEDLAKDLAKLLPFTLLAISMTKPGFFNFERILGKFVEIKTFFGDILHYLLFIIILELILRVFEIIFTLFEVEEIEVKEEVEEEIEVEGENTDKIN